MPESVTAAPPKNGDFFSSILGFFGDCAKGVPVVCGDVVHALGVAGATVGGLLVTDVSVNVLPALKTYFLAGGGLNVAGIVAVSVGATLSGLVALAAKSPNNVIATASTLVTPAEIAKVADAAGSAVAGTPATPSASAPPQVGTKP
jgi:hypothetical protein